MSSDIQKEKDVTYERITHAGIHDGVRVYHTAVLAVASEHLEEPQEST